MNAGRETERIIYSVRLRRGPDIVHYDLVFNEDGLELVYLGEYWDHHRPRRGLQRSVDLLLYRLNKRKNRVRAGTVVKIGYCEIREYILRRPLKLVRKRRVGGRTVAEEEVKPPQLILKTLNGDIYTIEFSPKVYELAKRLVRRILEPALRRCKEGR